MEIVWFVFLLTPKLCPIIVESGTKISAFLQKSILRISAKRNQKYLIEDVIILSNNNGNRMVRLLVTAVVIPEERWALYKK